MIILAIVCVLLLTGLRVAQEYQRGVVFRLGRYVGTRGPGLYWLIPLGVESQSLIDIRVKTVPVEQQETITRDSVTIRVNAVLWYKIVDPAMSVIAVTDGPSAVYQLALTSLRNIIGQHDLDEVLQSRDRINELLRQSTVSAATTWGISIERLEMKDVELPEAMQQVMAHAGRGHPGKTRPYHQGGGGVRGRAKADPSLGHDDGQPGRVGVAPHADDRGGRGRK